MQAVQIYRRNTQRQHEYIGAHTYMGTVKRIFFMNNLSCSSKWVIVFLREPFSWKFFQMKLLVKTIARVQNNFNAIKLIYGYSQPTLLQNILVVGTFFSSLMKKVFLSTTVLKTIYIRKQLYMNSRAGNYIQVVLNDNSSILSLGKM